MNSMTKHPPNEYISNVANDPSLEITDVLDFLKENAHEFWETLVLAVIKVLKNNLDMTDEEGLVLMTEGMDGRTVIASWDSFKKKDLEEVAKAMRKDYGPYNTWQ